MSERCAGVEWYTNQNTAATNNKTIQNNSVIHNTQINKYTNSTKTLGWLWLETM